MAELPFHQQKTNWNTQVSSKWLVSKRDTNAYTSIMPLCKNKFTT